MKWTSEKLDNLPVHFILCTERTGSSLLSLMLNLNDAIQCPSEEPFALYLAPKYSKIKQFTIEILTNYVEDFFLMAEKNIDLYFSKKDVFLENLMAHKDFLNYELLVKLTYLHFIDIKDKSEVKVIVDKQIKYFFYLPQLQQLFPKAKYIVLVRDVRDNIVSKKNRSLNWSSNPLFLACLWKQTYAQIEKLRSNEWMWIRYEDFVINTELCLQGICEFLNVPFQEKMMETKGVFQQLIAAKEKDLNPRFVKHLKDFHSGLDQVPNTSKIGQYKQLDAAIVSSVESICHQQLAFFGYIESNENITKNTSINSLFYCLLAKMYRKNLLAFYYKIPVSWKLRRKKSITKSWQA